MRLHKNTKKELLVKEICTCVYFTPYWCPNTVDYIPGHFAAAVFPLVELLQDVQGHPF